MLSSPAVARIILPLVPAPGAPHRARLARTMSWPEMTPLTRRLPSGWAPAPRLLRRPDLAAVSVTRQRSHDPLPAALETLVEAMQAPFTESRGLAHGWQALGPILVLWRRSEGDTHAYPGLGAACQEIGLSPLHVRTLAEDELPLPSPFTAHGFGVFQATPSRVPALSA